MPATHFCNCCNTPKAFTTRYSLDRHSKKGTKPFVCEYPECGKRYAQKTLLCDHERKQHLGVKNVPCRYCTEKFWSRSEANRHESKEHQLSLFRCALSLGDNPTCRHKGARTPDIIVIHARKRHTNIDAAILVVAPPENTLVASPALSPSILASTLFSQPSPTSSLSSDDASSISSSSSSTPSLESTSQLSSTSSIDSFMSDVFYQSPTMLSEPPQGQGELNTQFSMQPFLDEWSAFKKDADPVTHLIGFSSGLDVFHDNLAPDYAQSSLPKDFFQPNDWSMLFMESHTTTPSGL